MKILFAVDNLKCGGIQKAYISQLNTLDSNKYEIYALLRRKEGEWINQLNDNIKIIENPDYFYWLDIPKGKILKCIIRLLKQPTILYKFIFYTIRGIIKRDMTKQRQYLWLSIKDKIPKLEGYYDYAIDYSGTFRHYIVDKVDSKFKLSWIHSDYRVYQRDKNLDNIYFRLYDKIICVSDSCKLIFDNEFPEHISKSEVFENIVDKQNIIKKANEIVDFDNDYQGFRIIDVTRLVPGKYVELSIDVCELLVKENFDIKWYIVGDGPEFKRLYNLTIEKGISNNFVFLGMKPNPYPFIKKANIFVHCSHFEGKSVAIDEAIALNKLVIVNNYLTAKDQISNGVNGFIVETNKHELFKKIKDILLNKEMSMIKINDICQKKFDDIIWND